MNRTLIVFASLALCAGCFSPSYSDEPFICSAAAPTCPDGYRCDTAKGKCTNGGGNTGNCADKDLEPNDTPTTATSLDSALQSHPSGSSLYGLEICTPEDIDYYSFTMSATKNVIINIQYNASNGALSAVLQDANTNDVAQATPNGMGLQITSQLQAGLYLLRVAAGPGGTTNIYDFSLTIQ
jgi:hypothetical protein